MYRKTFILSLMLGAVCVYVFPYIRNGQWTEPWIWIVRWGPTGLALRFAKVCGTGSVTWKFWTIYLSAQWIIWTMAIFALLALLPSDFKRRINHVTVDALARSLVLKSLLLGLLCVLLPPYFLPSFGMTGVARWIWGPDGFGPSISRLAGARDYSLSYWIIVDSTTWLLFSAVFLMIGLGVRHFGKHPTPAT